jgi:DNA (cytosine-5)-methyltransferase 1
VKPRLLDLFCKAGGCSMGYHRAGFEVVGVDIEPQPRYPFEFHKADALEYPLEGFDVIHASPPCQAYSVSRTRSPSRKKHPDLVRMVADRLRATGLPFVVENVEGAPLRVPITLCGCMFKLGALGDDGVFRGLRRRRLFETNLMVVPPACCCDRREKIGVYGNGGGWANRYDPRRRGYKGNRREAREAMGIDWMTIAELSQAIPPAYTEWIGRQLLAQLHP